MKCFFPFKDKSKAKQEAQSAPELRNKNKSQNPALDRAVKSSGSLPSPRSIPELYKEKEHNLRVFSFEELRQSTNGFSRLLKIGEGGFGSVYRGAIRPASGQGNPLVVAIKKLKQNSLQVSSFTSLLLSYNFWACLLYCCLICFLIFPLILL